MKDKAHEEILNKLISIEEHVHELTILMKGNGGGIKEGVIWKVESLLETRAMDKRSTVLRYFVDRILPSLITTFIVAFVIFEFALREHLILSTP